MYSSNKSSGIIRYPYSMDYSSTVQQLFRAFGHKKLLVYTNKFLIFLIFIIQIIGGQKVGLLLGHSVNSLNITRYDDVDIMGHSRSFGCIRWSRSTFITQYNWMELLPSSSNQISNCWKLVIVASARCCHPAVDQQSSHRYKHLKQIQLIVKLILNRQENQLVAAHVHGRKDVIFA